MSAPDPKDVRLTAHALSELAPDQAEVAEAAVWADPEVREAVEDVRAVAEWLTFSFAAEPQLTLTPAQQRTVLARPGALTRTAGREARLTAFTLGELRPSQHAALAALLPDDRAARRLTEDIAVLADGLRRAFASEPEVSLTLRQRHHIRARATAADKERTAPGTATVVHTNHRLEPVERVGRIPWWRGVAAAAAGLALLGFAARERGPAPSGAPAVALVSDGPFSVRGPSSPPNPPPARAEPRATLLALLAKEERRPSLSAVVTPPETGTVLTTEPAPPPLVAATASSVLEPTPFSPRPQPDESLLPPAAAALVSEPVAERVASPGRLMAFASAHAGGTAVRPTFLETIETWSAYLPGMLGRAGYDVARQCVRDFGVVPPVAVVRPEELVNHFDYDVQPAPGCDLGVAVEAAACPWNERHHLVRVTVATHDATTDLLPPLRLTYFVRLADTQENERLQLLLWQAMQSLLPRLRKEDSLALAVWGRSQGIVLEPRGGWQHAEVRAAIEQLHRGGRSGGASAWTAASGLARRQFRAGALNRVIVVTDGPLDFEEAASLVSHEASLQTEGISVAVAQLGPRRSDGSLPAGTFQADSSAEAARLFARDTLQPDPPLARHLDIRLEFNPAAVRSWRPIGFDGPMAALSSSSTGTTWRAGRQVTGLYEIVPIDARSDLALRRAPPSVPPSSEGPSPPALSVCVRYERPGQSGKHTLTTEWTSSTSNWRAASPDFRLAAAAAGYALVLKADPGVENLAFATLRGMAESALAGHDEFGLRREFATLVADTERLLGGR